MSDILFHGYNRFGIIVTGGYSSEDFGVGSVYLTQNSLIKVGEVLVYLTPKWNRWVRVDLTGVTGDFPISVHPVKHRGQG